MNGQLIVADPRVEYNVKEAVVLVIALAWCIMLGSTALASLIICGWRRASKVDFDYRHMRVIFYCR